MSDADETDWLHRNDAYNMHAKQGGTGPNLNAHTNFGGACSVTRLPGNIILCIMFCLFLQYMLSNTDPTNNRRSTTRRPQLVGQSWYARLSNEKRADYLQRQRIARQQKRAAASTGVH
jgi:hypothetical protein